MRDRVLIGITGSGLERASCSQAGKVEVETLLAGTNVCCLAADPLIGDRVYAGTEGRGVLRSDDRGQSWRAVGLAGVPVKAMAASPVQKDVVYAGTKPARRLGGGLPQPLAHMPYALVTDPRAPGALYAGLSNGEI